MVCDVVLEASVRKMILKGIVIVTCDGDDERAMAMELQASYKPGFWLLLHEGLRYNSRCSAALMINNSYLWRRKGAFTPSQEFEVSLSSFGHQNLSTTAQLTMSSQPSSSEPRELFEAMVCNIP
jgi:hypothetical protein